MFRGLGKAVTQGRGGRETSLTNLAYANLANQEKLQNAPVMPAPIPPPRPPMPPQLNPAERAFVQAELKEGREVKKQAEARVHHKGQRKSYIPELGYWMTKPEMLERLQQHNERQLREFTGNQKEREELIKEQARRDFGITKQYNLSKHEPRPNDPYNPFGNMDGKASAFLTGSYDYEKRPDGTIDFEKPKNTKGWQYMSPAEKDALIAADAALKKAPEIIAQKQKRQQEAQIREHGQQAQQKAQQQAQQEAERQKNLTPAEREQENYNRQLAEYLDQQHRYEYQNQAQLVNQNREAQGRFGFNQNVPVPQPVLNELISMMNSQPVRYVPVRPRPSLNDRVMNSFGQNMFSPEFIPEEE
jgi:hypothetical protein